MGKLKLKPGMEVVYLDLNLIDKTSVVSIDKKNGTARLANGIVLNREVLKKGYFKRSGIRSDAKAYYYKEGEDFTGNRIYEAYKNKIQLKGLLPMVKKAIEDKDLITDYGWLKEFRSIIERFIG